MRILWPGLWPNLWLVMAGMAMADVQTHKGYEMLPYTVESVADGVELRRYGPHVVAEVTVSGDRSTAIRRGFGALAGYIFGGNAVGEKIAMTVPVAQTEAGSDTWTVQFTMPGAYSVATLPVPRDTAVKLRQVAGNRQAVVTFTGLPQTADMQARAATLRDWIAARGLTITAGPHYQFYDAPLTLPWRRRNEVSFTVK